MSLPGRRVSGAPVLGVCCVLSSIVGPAGIRIQAGMNAGTHRRGGPSFYFSLRGLVWRQGWGPAGRKYYNNLNVKIFNDNKAFWKGIKPLISDKQAITQTNIVVVDKDGVTSDNFKVAQKLNDFFTDAVDNLGIEPFYPQACLGEYTQPENGIKEIIRKYNTHPSIVKIKENVDMNEKFNFQDISSNEIKTYIHKIDTTKASIENDFPAKILIGSSEISSDYLSAIYNDSVRDNCYPFLLKRATIIPIEKQEQKL